MTGVDIYIKHSRNWDRMAKKIEVITSLFNAATERPSPPDQSLSYFDGMRGTQRRKISFLFKKDGKLRFLCGQRLVYAVRPNSCCRGTWTIREEQHQPSTYTKVIKDTLWIQWSLARWFERGINSVSVTIFPGWLRTFTDMPTIILLHQQNYLIYSRQYVHSLCQTFCWNKHRFCHNLHFKNNDNTDIF